MKIFIIGSGGRECALAWRLAQDKSVSSIIVSPGNHGMPNLNSKIEITPGKSIDHFLAIAKKEKVTMTFVGPEDPLVEGIVDIFKEHQLKIIGPCAKAAKLEGSKIFSKEFMDEFDIPTARFVVATNYDDACRAIDHWTFSAGGYVIKADGLAGGKGVVVAKTEVEAKQALYDFMVDDSVSVKTSEILLEEVLIGREASFFALCDGEDYEILGMVCDHKRLLDGDEGPNTGGMGCFRSLTWPTSQVSEKIEKRVLQKTLKGMVKRGTPYQGILFIGVMINDLNEPYVVEYNVRFGDPETQTLMPLIQGDFSEHLYAAACGELNSLQKPLLLSEQESVHIVMVSKGYPSIGKHIIETGYIIDGASDVNDALVFYAGVSRDDDQLVTSGGRVLGVTALGSKLQDACNIAYKNISKINYTGAFYRKDIARKML